MVSWRFVEPLDVLFLRGNRLFGEAGSYGESLVPPWPSAVAGALRARMLVDRHPGWAPARQAALPEDPELGTPEAPGAFTVAAFHLARRGTDGHVEPVLPMPADLVVTGRADGAPEILAMRPRRLAEGIGSSFPEGLPKRPVLAQPRRAKPASGWWLTAAGWKRYLAGGVPAGEGELVHARELWLHDERVGVGLDADTRRASDGRLFTVQAVAMRLLPGDGGRHAGATGFLVGVEGAEPPREGLLRLGGDGRAAVLRALEGFTMPEPDWDAVAASRRCRLVLTAPGIFEAGWLPPGAAPADGAVRFELHGVRGRIVCAAVPRYQVVSGWDLARWEPKAAERAVAPGAVYWLELDEGVGPDDLRRLAARGLWTEAEHARNPRRAEGFNRVAVAAWGG